MKAALHQISAKGGTPLLGTVRRRGRQATWLSHPLLPPLATLTLGTLLATLCYNLLLVPQIDVGLRNGSDGDGSEEVGPASSDEGVGPKQRKFVRKQNPYDAEHSLSSANIIMDDRRMRGQTDEGFARLPSAPETTILSGPDKFSSDQKPIIKFAADRSGCSFEIMLDDSRWISASSPLRFKQPLSDGNHTFVVRAIDSKGVKDKNPAQLHWTVDTLAPKLRVARAPAQITHETVARFELESSEPRCKFPFQLEYRRTEQQGWTSADSAEKGGGGIGHTEGVVAELLDPSRIRLSVKGVLEGQHRLYIMAVDEAGNEGEQEEFIWTVDTTPPKTVIKQAPKRFTKSKVAVFAISATGVEGGWGFQYRLNEEKDWTQGSTDTPSTQYEDAYQLTLKGMIEGPQRLSVRAVDRAGNIDKSGATYQWTIHDQPADTIILSGPKEMSNSRSASFSISSSETWFSYAYRLDRAAVQRPEGLKLVAAPATFNITDLSEGNHTIMVRATDVTGGEDPTPAVYRWYVDLTPPTGRLLHQPPKVSLDTNAIFGIDADEAYILQYKLDRGMWQNSDGSIIRSTDGAFATYELTPRRGPIRFKISGLTEGRHELRLNITDAVGNTNSMAPIVWVVDFGPPSTTVEKTPPQQTKSKKAMFIVSASEPDCVIQYRIDRKAWTNPGKDPQVVKARPIAGREDKSAVSMEVWAGVGFHVIEFRAKDAAGNTDSKAAPFEWVTF